MVSNTHLSKTVFDIRQRGALLDHASYNCLDGCNGIFTERGSSAYPQTFCGNARIKHSVWNITISKWQSGDVKSKMVSLVEEAGGKDTILQFDLQVNKVLQDDRHQKTRMITSR